MIEDNTLSSTAAASSEINNVGSTPCEDSTSRQKLVVWAKVTGHPFWPARHCDEDEKNHHVRFKQRKNDILVHFFEAGDSGSYGWVIPSNVKPFDPSELESYFKGKKNKALKSAISSALDFCENKEPYAPPQQLIVKDDGVCCICGKDEAIGTIIICDACDNEYHLSCLNPPIDKIPEGDWFCITCVPSSSSKKRAATKELGSAPKKTSGDVEYSEDRCGVCACEGELLVCDFSGCSKVYHSSCIWPKSSGAETVAQWTCPRHSCSICGCLEKDSEKHWKCSNCIFSCCGNHESVFSALSINNICYLCSSKSPVVELAEMLHGAWSKMSTHYLSLPFLRPFLSQNDEHDLFAIVEKIRRLDYTQVSEFNADISDLRDRCLALASDYPMIQQAFDTLVIDSRHFLNKNGAKLNTIEERLKRGENHNCSLLNTSNSTIGLFGHIDKSLPSITPSKTLEEWKDYVLNPPVNAIPEEEAPPVNTVASILLDLCYSSDSQPLKLDPQPKSNRKKQNEISLPHHRQTLLDTQGGLLHQMMTTHSQLRDEWRQSQEKLLISPDAGEESAITLGESHVMLELQMSNQALKAQLDQYKASLVSKNQALQVCVLERNQLKLRNEQLEAMLNKNGASDNLSSKV